MSVNRLGRVYQYILYRLKTPVLAVPGYLAVRTFFRLRLALTRGAADTADPARAREKLQALFPKAEAAPAVPVNPENDGTDLTVIIPAYNAADTIAACVGSVTRQETGGYSMEILVVDDGSADGTGAVLDGIAASRPEVKVFHRANAGAASSRNFGLDHAHGRYIMFIDADDRLTNGAVKALMDAAKKEDADFVQGSWQYENGSVQRFEARTAGKEALVGFIEIPGMPWGKVIRRSVFENIRFPLGFNSFADTAIKCLVFRNISRVALIPDVVYSYRRNPNGITVTSRRSLRSLQTYWLQEVMERDAARLGLGDDALGCAILLQQLTPIAVGRIAGLDEDVCRAVFAVCRDMALRRVKPEIAEQLPFAQRCAYRIFQRGDRKAWMYLGKRWQYIL